MSPRKSRYAETFDYDHRFKAGNVADVFKHCVLRAWVSALQNNSAVHVLETHGGSGTYKLPPQGEWQQGIGLLDAADGKTAPAMVRGYVEASGAKRAVGKGGLYPGSPAFIRKLLRDGDRLTVCELMQAPRDKLATYYADDDQVEIVGGDGLQRLREAAENHAAADGVLAAFIDPPYVSKQEWSDVAAAVLEASRACPSLVVAIWYPIKSLTRPRGLASQLRNGGLAGFSADLITTPLRLQKKRLNGSGLLFVGAPGSFGSELPAPMQWLGQTLSTDGEWSATVTGWSGSDAGLPQG